MTLLSILLGFALEYFSGSFDRFRNYDWFDGYFNWLETRCRPYPLWDGTVGVLLTLALPLIVLLLLSYFLGKIFIGLPFLLAILVFVYSLGPNMNVLLNNYAQALEGNIIEDIAVIEDRLNLRSQPHDYNDTVTISAILLRSHEYIFGVVFWFIILGMPGALIYCLTAELDRRFGGVHGGYATAVHELRNILMWPSARLLAIGFALSGSLVDTLEAWRKVEGDTFDLSQEVIVASGLGALQYEEQVSGDDDAETGAKAHYIQSIRETQALINRSLIIWLTALGFLTIGGILS